MIASPSFPPRSSFPGTVQLVVASSILFGIQSDNAVELIRPKILKLLIVLGSIYVATTVSATFYGFYDYNLQVQGILNSVKNSVSGKNNNIVIVNSLTPVPEVVLSLSGYRLLHYVMSDDENDWRNVAFTRYYGIKGIRMIDSGEESAAANQNVK